MAVQIHLLANAHAHAHAHVHARIPGEVKQCLNLVTHTHMQTSKITHVKVHTLVSRVCKNFWALHQPPAKIYRGLALEVAKGPPTIPFIRVGQNRTDTLYMTVHLVLSLPRISHIHRIYLYGSGQP